MTSQAMILTKDAITLASDMAVTLPNYKSYTSMNKIFKPKNDFPIGIMANGNVDFEEISIQTLICEFSKNTDFKKLKSVKKIKDRFIEYLSKNTDAGNVDDYISWILESFKKELEEDIQENGFERTLRYRKKREIPDFVKGYRNFDDEFCDILPENKDEYVIEIWKIFSYELQFEGTGIIFAGFDEGNFYPSFFEINLHCNDNGKIIYDEIDSKVNCIEPVIKVFAINEEAYAFLTGVNDDFEDYIKGNIEIYNNYLIDELKVYLDTENIDEKNRKKILQISEILLKKLYVKIPLDINYYKIDTLDETSESIKYLPNSVLWELSAQLIKLTALKQKLSSEIETVSIETEIASITKVDNFKWIEHKNI